MIDTERFRALADQQLNQPYLLGAKWDPEDPAPIGPCDCSGAVRWLVRQATGILVPDGSEIQREASVLLAADEVQPFMAYGYFLDHEVSDHIFVLYDDAQVWNAEGAPWDRVLLRPRDRFEAWRGFSGWLTFPALLTI